MSEPAVRLDGVREATDELSGVAGQALEWVRVSEERVARAEAKTEEVHAELKQRAMQTLEKIGAEGRERIAAERKLRKEADQRATTAERARDRAERSFEQARVSERGDREALAAEIAAQKERAEEERAQTVKQLGEEAEKRLSKTVVEVRSEADSRVAAAEQRAAEAEAAAEESRRIAIKIESEIEERVMQGTEDVRREADERVRQLVEKFEGEAEELARARAHDQLEAESDRIRRQAEQREDRARQVAEDEIKASATKARREALAAAEETAPSWADRDEQESTVSGYRTF